MPDTPTEITQYIEKYNREELNQILQEAKEKRERITSKFPISSWQKMTREQYALGLETSGDSFCWWLEFGSKVLGSVKGGTSRKFAIYFKVKQKEWYFNKKKYKTVEDAWSALRNGFGEAFSKAQTGSWNEIDFIDALDECPMVRVKTIYLFFPNEILPVYSRDHLLHFLKLLNLPEGQQRTYDVVRLNRALLLGLRSIPQLGNWDNLELMRMLYAVWNPKQVRKVFKIAPGDDAKYWSECLSGSYICVGWDDVGDLREFESKEEFKKAFAEYYYRDDPRQSSRKGNELWTLMNLEEGDLIAANQGISKILAVGEVIDPGYDWMPEREDMKHVVHVKWDTSYNKAITPQKKWAFVTIDSLAPDLAALILKKEEHQSAPLVGPATQQFANIQEALEAKGQVILYGPPGTGKTYTAKRFAEWWLQKNGHGDTQTKTKGGVPPLTCITFHASYSYEDFVEGFRPVKSPTGGLNLDMVDGSFKIFCTGAAKDPDRPYLMLIDEINRAHVAKVFGELITTLELDKREQPVALAQSKEEFRTPRNVYIVATMNTADRSIKLLDSAFRRRFAFIEMMPDSELLVGGKIGELPLDLFLEKLNARIARREGREKQIGHSYLLQGGQPIDEKGEFARRFRHEILPLLKEYCYDDYLALSEIIGPELVDSDNQVLNDEVVDDDDRLVAALLKTLGSDQQAPEAQ